MPLKRVADSDAMTTSETPAPPAPDPSGFFPISSTDIQNHGTFYWDPVSQRFTLNAWACAAYQNVTNTGQVRFRMRWGVPRLVATVP